MNGNFKPNTGVVVNKPMNSTLPENATPQEYSKFLYDTGLQNVFNNYQQGMAKVGEQEQKQLQDAYFIREMSKKYLGEYASNIGIGDVSGNLMDIYGQYQQNISSIQQNYDALSLNLQQTYDQQQQDLFSQAMQRQMEIDQGERTEAISQIGFNVATGNTGGKTWLEYLNSERDAGRLTQAEYGTLYRESYLSNYQQFNQTFQNGNFGFKTGADGKLTPKTALEYLEENKSWLNPTDYNKIRQAIQYGEQFPTPTIETGLYATNRLVENVFGNITGGQSSVELTITVGGQPNQFVSTDVSVPTTLANTLTDKFEATGQTYQSGQSYVNHQGNYYVWLDTNEGGQWFRMQNVTTVLQDIDRWTQPYTDSEGVQQPMESSTWKAASGEDWDSNNSFVRGGVTFNTNSDSRKTTIVYRGTTFEFDSTFEKQEAREDASGNAALRAAYAATHGNTRINNAFFYYEGEFYALVQRGSGRWFFRRYTKKD